MRKLFRVGCIAAGVMAAACDWELTGLEFDGGGCGFLFEPRPCVALGMSPLDGHYLRGDTVGFYAYSDSGLTSFSWSMTGDALRFVQNGTLTQQVAAHAASVNAVMVEPGSSTVTVTSAPQGRAVTAQVGVHDSTEITRVYVWAPSSLAVPRVGDTLYTAADLYAGQVHVNGRAIGWFSKDTTVLVVFSQLLPGAVRPWIRVRAVKPGSAYIVATFLGVRDSVLVTVTQQ